MRKKSIIERIYLKLGKILRDRFSIICHGSQFLSAIYYLIFDRSFRREQKAVLSGKVKHIKEAKQLKANYFLLVRNIHRIEKGLLMRPRKSVFGKDYILETIDSFEGVSNSSIGLNNSQSKWFFDVLEEYFKVANDEDPFVSKMKARFYKIVEANIQLNDLASQSNKSVPYFRQEASKSSISYEEFYLLTRQRRSVRWFLDKSVPREIIDKAILAANQSPSACNRQPYEFRIIDDPSAVAEVVKFPMGTGGYGHSIPVMIVIVGNLDAYFDERDRHVIYIDASLASMSLMLALETLGLSSCAINWPDIEFREKQMDQFLKLESHQRSIMCLGLGYPDPEGKVAFSEKRAINNIRKYN